MSINATKYFNDYSVFDQKIKNLETLAQPKPTRSQAELQQLEEAFIKVAKMHQEYQLAQVNALYRFAEDNPGLINEYAPLLQTIKQQHERTHKAAMAALTAAQTALQNNKILCSPYLLPPSAPKPSLLSRIGAVAQKNIDRVGKVCLIATAAIGLQYFTGQVFPIAATTAGIYTIERIALSLLAK